MPTEVERKPASEFIQERLAAMKLKTFMATLKNIEIRHARNMEQLQRSWLQRNGNDTRVLRNMTLAQAIANYSMTIAEAVYQGKKVPNQSGFRLEDNFEETDTEWEDQLNKLILTE